MNSELPTPASFSGATQFVRKEDVAESIPCGPDLDVIVEAVKAELPDRIVVYREPHLAVCEDEEGLRDELHTTLVHEIAHFYGLDDAQLHDLGWA